MLIKAAEIQNLAGSYSSTRRQQSVISLLLFCGLSLSTCQGCSLRCLGAAMCCLVLSNVSCFKWSNRGVSSAAKIWLAAWPRGHSPDTLASSRQSVNACGMVGAQRLLTLLSWGKACLWLVYLYSGQNSYVLSYACTLLWVFSFHLYQWRW